MIMYRAHISSFIDVDEDDPIRKPKSFNSLDDMKDHLVEAYNGNIDKDDIVILKGDEIGSSKDCVCVKGFGDDDFIKKYNSPQCIGYCWEE